VKVLLMHPAVAFDPKRPLPEHSSDLVEDLGLERLFVAMAGNDKLAYAVAKAAVLSPLPSTEEITWRQEVLADCVAQPQLPAQLYALAGEALESHKRLTFWGLSHSPESLRYYSVQALEVLLRYLEKFRRFAMDHAGEVTSAGFRQLFSMLSAELDEGYLDDLRSHMTELKLPRGLFMSAALGRANKGTAYTLHRQPPHAGLRQRFSERNTPSYSFEIPERDEAGTHALAELHERGVNIAANALAQSVDHVLGFLSALRTEVVFYLGCLNLKVSLEAKGEPTCVPSLLPPGTAGLSAAGLYEPGLSLAAEGHVVGNDVEAKGRAMVVVTGANRGGKSTFLRSVAIAQLMMQAGMFVAARSFAAAPAPAVLTHFKREEDRGSQGGKFDEELRRMSRVISALSPGCILFSNEPFGSTNEREGSDVGRQVFVPLANAGVRVFLVTHLFDLADSLYKMGSPEYLFLRAPRQSGAAPFRLVEGAPEATAYGEDVYRRIFGKAPGEVALAATAVLSGANEGEGS
jgi:DNA mismatch repair ATPase MutS